MNSLILISPAPGSGFQPILSGKKSGLTPPVRKFCLEKVHVFAADLTWHLQNQLLLAIRRYLHTCTSGEFPEDVNRRIAN